MLCFFHEGVGCKRGFAGAADGDRTDAGVSRVACGEGAWAWGGTSKPWDMCVA